MDDHRWAANIMFVGTQCPGCGHVWTEDDDLLWGARTRASDPPEAWHDECIRKEHPELFEEATPTPPAGNDDDGGMT